MSEFIPFPYPVLGNNEGINGSFSPSVKYTISETNIELEIQLKLDNYYYEELVKNKDAVFFIDITCNRTYYRKTFETYEQFLHIDEPADSFSGKVNVRFYICAKRVIGDYHPLSLLESWEIDAGEIIAVGGTASFIVEKEYDPLKAPVRSIIKIMNSDSVKNKFDIVYDSDEYITILVPDDMYDLYSRVRAYSAEVLHSCLVLPALVDAVSMAQKEDYVNTAWAQKLNELYELRNIDQDAEPLQIAQTILDNPVMRTLAWCDKQKDEEE